MERKKAQALRGGSKGWTSLEQSQATLIGTADTRSSFVPESRAHLTKPQAVDLGADQDMIDRDDLCLSCPAPLSSPLQDGRRGLRQGGACKVAEAVHGVLDESARSIERKAACGSQWCIQQLHVDGATKWQRGCHCGSGAPGATQVVAYLSSGSA